MADGGSTPPSSVVGYQDENDVNLRVPYVFGSSRPRDLSYLDFLPAKLRVYNTRLHPTPSKEEPTLKDYLRQLRAELSSVRPRTRDRSVDSASRYYVFGSSTPRDLSYLDKIPWEYRIYDVKLGWRQRRRHDKRSKTTSFSSSGSAGNSRRRASSLNTLHPSPSPNGKSEEKGRRLARSTHGGRNTTTSPIKLTLSPVGDRSKSSQSSRASGTVGKTNRKLNNRSVSSSVQERTPVNTPITIQCPTTPTISSTVPSRELEEATSSPISDEFFVVPAVVLRSDTDFGIIQFQSHSDTTLEKGEEENQDDQLNGSSHSLDQMAAETARDVINEAEIQAGGMMKLGQFSGKDEVTIDNDEKCGVTGTNMTVEREFGHSKMDEEEQFGETKMDEKGFGETRKEEKELVETRKEEKQLVETRKEEKELVETRMEEKVFEETRVSEPKMEDLVETRIQELVEPRREEIGETKMEDQVDRMQMEENEGTRMKMKENEGARMKMEDPTDRHWTDDPTHKVEQVPVSMTMNERPPVEELRMNGGESVPSPTKFDSQSRENEYLPEEPTASSDFAVQDAASPLRREEYEIHKQVLIDDHLVPLIEPPKDEDEEVAKKEMNRRQDDEVTKENEMERTIGQLNHLDEHTVPDPSPTLVQSLIHKIHSLSYDDETGLNENCFTEFPPSYGQVESPDS